MSLEKRLFLTGASGLLGRAIYSKFVQEGWNVYAVAFSRVKEGYHKLDITDESAVKKAILDFKPSIIIHCAAQRFPDLVDKNPDGAVLINVDASKFIAQAAASFGCRVIYISTDYVFDGKSAPYAIDAKTNPVNLYGKTKLQGERVTTEISSNNLILRVPVLYGPVEKLPESAVTVLLEPLLNKSKITEVSNYERRRPSHVNDISVICLQLANAVTKGDKLEGIFHWCGSEELKKYDMIIRMAKLFGLEADHIKPNNSSGSSSTIRPYNTTLDTSRLVSLGFGQHTSFDVGIKDALSSWLKK